MVCAFDGHQHYIVVRPEPNAAPLYLPSSPRLVLHGAGLVTQNRRWQVYWMHEQRKCKVHVSTVFPECLAHAGGQAGVGCGSACGHSGPSQQSLSAQDSSDVYQSLSQQACCSAAHMLCAMHALGQPLPVVCGLLVPIAVIPVFWMKRQAGGAGHRPAH